jgi:hypothetical protein
MRNDSLNFQGVEDIYLHYLKVRINGIFEILRRLTEQNIFGVSGFFFGGIGGIFGVFWNISGIFGFLRFLKVFGYFSKN